MLRDLSGLPALAGGWWILPALSLAHLFYLALWSFPAGWLGLCRLLPGAPGTGGTAAGDHACRIMSYGAHLIKVVQYSSLLLWLLIYCPEALTAPPAAFLVGGLLCIGAGQSLNVATYKAIGLNGVYYGNAFGARLPPWCTGFPFNCPGPIGRHPQYSGCILTVAGAALLTFPACKDVAVLAGVWTSFYIFTGMVEMTERPRNCSRCKDS